MYTRKTYFSDMWPTGLPKILWQHSLNNYWGFTDIFSKKATPALLQLWTTKLSGGWKCKWSFWVNFSPSKVPECLHVLFSLVIKHSPVLFLPEFFKTNKSEQKSKTKYFLLFRLIAFTVHASIFCPRFSQKQSASQPKKYRGMFYY